MCLLYPGALSPSGSILVAVLFRGTGRPIVLLKKGYDFGKMIKISALKNSSFYEVELFLRSHEKHILEDFIDGESTLLLIYDSRVLSRK